MCRIVQPAIPSSGIRHTERLGSQPQLLREIAIVREELAVLPLDQIDTLQSIGRERSFGRKGTGSVLMEVAA